MSYRLSRILGKPVHADGYDGFDTRLMVRGHIGVDLFFMLSGFVLARAFEGRMPAPFEFLKLRFRRLWLLMAVGTAMGALYFLWRGSSPMDLAPHLVFGLLIIPAIGFHIALNPPAWSIFFELVANWLHAAVFQRLSVKALVCVAGICALILFLFTSEHAMNVGQGETFWLGFPRVIMGYTIGVVLYRLNGDAQWLPKGLA